MLTDEDIKKLSMVLAIKEDIKDLREETDALRENVQNLTTVINNLRTRYLALSG